MAKETVLIGCRLPNGLVLHHPKNRNITVRLAGTYETKLENGLFVPPKMFSTTVVDAEFWGAWKEAYSGFPPLKNRAVFEAHSDQEATAKGRELKKEKTGFEPMEQDSIGVKPATKD